MHLTKDSDFRRFVAPNVDPAVKNAAMKKLFHGDPHFNIMDGLDTYIDDYGKPDPLPLSMLRQMTMGKFLGFLTEEEEAAQKAAQASAQTSAPTTGPDAADVPSASTRSTTTPSTSTPGTSTPGTEPATLTAPEPEAPANENADLQLQRHDAAGRERAEERARQDPGRER